VANTVGLREEDPVRILIAGCDLHSEDEAGQIGSISASGSEFDVRRKRHAI
jgi:hypothetical protein